MTELAERVEVAGGADRALDGDIHSLVSADRKHPYIAATFIPSSGAPYGSPRYTSSLDAALTLYVEVPERIPSNPRLATAEALRARKD